MRCGIGDFGMGHRWEDAEEDLGSSYRRTLLHLQYSVLGEFPSSVPALEAGSLAGNHQ